MMTHIRFQPILMVVFAMMFLSACSETRFVTSGAKQTGITQSETQQGYYKVGTPYQIKGVWYYPKEDFDYVETGIASWYGPKFDGKPTANGEVFDMELVSAAHRTLPMPSMVRVTNLENGRSLITKVNDRGPFAHGRIIDMSKRGAQLLGFEQQGTARVKVEILKEQSLAIKNAMTNSLAANEAPIKTGSLAKPQVSSQSLDAPTGAQSAPTQQVASNTAVAAPSPEPLPEIIDTPARVSAPPAPRSQAITSSQPNPAPATEVAQKAPTSSWSQEAPKSANKVQQTAVSPTQMFVQAGAFSRYDNANRVKAKLDNVGTVNISQVLVNGRDFYRVRVGPVSNVPEADRLLENVINAGYPSAKIIVVKN